MTASDYLTHTGTWNTVLYAYSNTCKIGTLKTKRNFCKFLIEDQTACWPRKRKKMWKQKLDVNMAS